VFIGHYGLAFGAKRAAGSVARSPVHSVSARRPALADATDWPQILQLYDHLLALASSPVVALHRAVAVGEVDGPNVALILVDALASDLGGLHLFHAIRADLLRRLGRTAEAVTAYDHALARADNGAERAFLQHRRQALTGMH
jgi:RNA polymerase sigma-70 factor (ECF subfamily)